MLFSLIENDVWPYTAGMPYKNVEDRRANSRVYARGYRKKKRAEGRCECNAPRASGKNYCENCLDAKSTAQKNRQAKRRKEGLCLACGQPASEGHATCASCRERLRGYGQQHRHAALEAYGLACECCGEDTYDFLTIDHVNNNGAEHRKEIGTNIYRWLKENDYPEGFQTLCYNCNMGKRLTGICPHQRAA